MNLTAAVRAPPAFCTLSSTAVTVTAWATHQFCGVNVSDTVAPPPTCSLVVSLVVTATVTSAVGWEVSDTFSVSSPSGSVTAV